MCKITLYSNLLVLPAHRVRWHGIVFSGLVKLGLVRHGPLSFALYKYMIFATSMDHPNNIIFTRLMSTQLRYTFSVPFDLLFWGNVQVKRILVRLNSDTWTPFAILARSHVQTC